MGRRQSRKASENTTTVPFVPHQRKTQMDRIRGMMALVNRLGIKTALLMTTIGLWLSPCGCQEQKLSSGMSHDRFDQAGPLRVEVDLSRLTRAKGTAGDYRLTTGDVLLLRMPAVTLSATQRSPDDEIERNCRVRQDGSIRLPVIGSVQAEGKTLQQLETAVAEAYYPRFVTHRPTIVAEVVEHRMQRVNVLGSVREPGAYELPARDCTLVSALLAAGGLDKDTTATVRIRGAGGELDQPRVIVLPVKGLDMPFVDVPLADGQTIEVQKRKREVFTVTGLVKKPGTYPYPPDAEYTLLQALAMGGGINEVADPLYATVYRQDADGQCVHTRFKLSELAGGAEGQLKIKPGDVLALEKTTRTQVRMLLAGILRLGAGVNVSAGYQLAP